MYIKNKVVYQVYPKSFCDSTGDGQGDLRGIISKLDYLQTLGIDCIWMNPIFVSPQRDNGYDVADYRTIDPRYGTMEDFETLCNEAKQRNIDIMLDMVFNHTSTQHEWFQKALAGEKKYQDYYILKQGPSDQAPNNWQSKFGGPAWEYSEQMQCWYLHLFDVTQADLNWENPEVRRELADIVNYWKEKGVKGFRFDVVNLISKGSYDNDPNNYDGRQFYTDGPHVHEYLKELNEHSFGIDEDCMTVGEMSSTTLENCILYSGSHSHELNSVFTFHHLKVDYKDQQKWVLQPFDFQELKNLFIRWQTGMQEADAWNALFWNNHDQPRALSRFGDDKNYPRESATMLATALHMMRGTPYIYQGEEIGMTNAYFDSIDQYEDVESINFYNAQKEKGTDEKEILHILNERSRDNARTPMQWSNGPQAGFTTGTPWLSINENYQRINVEHELADNNSIFHYYQALIKLRKQYDVIQNGRFESLLETHPQIYAYKRITDQEELLVVTNFYAQETTLDLDTSEYEILLRNTDGTNDSVLSAYEARIYYKKQS